MYQRPTTAKWTWPFGRFTVMASCPDQVRIGILVVGPGKSVAAGNFLKHGTSGETVIHH